VKDIVPVPDARLEDVLASASPDLLREMIKGLAQRMMDAEVEALCGAGYGEVSADRVNSRNGYRRREWDTRAGTIELAIPKLRQGSYYPEWLLKRRRRAERALATSPDSPVNDLGDQQGVRDLDRLHRPAVPLDG
jgi:putative transposase